MANQVNGGVSQLVGFKRFMSKKGKEYCVVNVVTPYSDRERENQNYGSKVEEIFLPDNCIGALSVKDIGKRISFLYEVSNGRAYVQDIIIDKN